MDPRQEIEVILKQDGATFLRQRKHHVYKLSNGKTFVRSSSPSDPFGYNMALRDLKKLLGLQPPPMNAPVLAERGERKRITSAPKRIETVTHLSGGGRSMRSELQIKLAGLQLKARTR